MLIIATQFFTLFKKKLKNKKYQKTTKTKKKCSWYLCVTCNVFFLCVQLLTCSFSKKSKYKKLEKSNFTKKPDVKRKKLRDQIVFGLLGHQAIKNNKKNLKRNYSHIFSPHPYKKKKKKP